jgi:hypothetical protein
VFDLFALEMVTALCGTFLLTSVSVDKFIGYLDRAPFACFICW